MLRPKSPRRETFRSLFVSDLHLGSRSCQAQHFLDFLQHTETEHIYLLGDIIDGWRLRKGWFWPTSHQAVVEQLLARARQGVNTIYVPGNHDEFARRYIGLEIAGVPVQRDSEHITADGRRLLLTHGDAFDGLTTCPRWLTMVGDGAHHLVNAGNTLLNRMRQQLGLGYWSLARHIKDRVAQAKRYVAAFEEAVAGEARRQRYDGVVCGHIHKPALRSLDGVLYANDGDWVESCTALVEHQDGQLELLQWPGLCELPTLSPARAA